MNLPNNHNGGPPLDPFDAMKVHIDDLYELASGIGDITTQAQADQITALRDDLKRAAADADNARKAEKQPSLDEGKRIDGKWKPLTDRPTLGVKVCNAALTPWNNARQAEKDAESERLRKEAEELAAAATTAFQESKATDLDARAEAEELAKKASKAAAVAKRIDKAPTGLRTYWTSEVTNYGELLAYMKEHRPADLKAMLQDYAAAKCRAGERNLPGVSFTSEKRAV